jgi:hypothetical protein
MKTLYELFCGARPPAPDAPAPSIQGALAYACMDCHRMSEGSDRGTCHCCGSSAIFHIVTVLNARGMVALSRTRARVQGKQDP